MDRSTPIPDTAGPLAIDRAELIRFAAALSAIDRYAVPDDPLAREVHLAVDELDRFGVSEPTNERLAELLRPLHLAMAGLENAPVDGIPAHTLIELVVRLDDAKSLLETPDLSVVATGQLAGRLRALYGGITRLRGVSLRLHRAWRQECVRQEAQQR